MTDHEYKPKHLDETFSPANPKAYAKAIGGAILAGLITLAGVAAGASSPADVTFMQWIIVATSVLGTGLGVYAIPNKPTSKE